MTLDALLNERGAVRDSAGVVVDYGGHEAECRALLEAAGLVTRPDLCAVELQGPSALELLHNVTTQALKDLKVGGTRPACLLTPKGRILGCFDVVVGDSVRLILAREALPRVQPVLARYGMLLDVEVLEPAAGQHVCELIGPTSAAVLAAAGLPVPAPGAHAQTGAGLVVNRSVGDLPGQLLLLDTAGVMALAATDGVTLVGQSARERLRLDVGVPRDGQELSDTVLFNEAGLEDRVSWNKGCYPGQEPVVMAKHRGHPPRHLCHLTLEGDALPAPGTALTLEGREVGTITSAALGLRTPALRALAYVRHAAAEAGTDLSLPSGGTAHIDRLC